MALPGYMAASNIEDLDSNAIQPAGVDLRVCEILSVLDSGVLGLDTRILPESSPVDAGNGWWSLQPGAYKVRFCEIVKIPSDQVALCFPRSTLLRMAADLRCTVWDPGYRGRGEGLLIVYNPSGIRLQRGARVAQLVFFKLVSSPDRLYSGIYQGENIDTLESR